MLDEVPTTCAHFVMVRSDIPPEEPVSRQPSDPEAPIDPETLAVSRQSCEKCGQVHPRCLGHNTLGHPCGSKPPLGCEHCRRHGAAPQVVDASLARTREIKAEAVARTYGVAAGVTPQRGMQDVLDRTAAAVEWLGRRIAALDPAALTWVQSSEEARSGTFRGSKESSAAKTWSAQINKLVVLYQQERKLEAAIAADMVRLNLQEREVRLDELQAEELIKVINATLDDPDLDLDEAKRQAGRQAAARHLHMVKGVA